MKKQLIRMALSALLICCVLVCMPHASAAYSVLNLPENTQRVEMEAFMGDSSFSLVVIPECTTYIGVRAFAFTSVTEVTLSTTLTFIDDTAFEDTPLQKVNAVKGTYAYEWAVRMGYILPETDPEIFTYSVSDDKATVTGFADADNYPESIVIPQANPDGLPVVGIGSGAFKGKANLREVVLQENIVSVAANAFQNCTLLEKLVLSEGLETIGGTVNNVNGAFAGCVKLTEVTIPSTVKTIANRAFYGCSLLESLMIRGSDDCQLSIGESAFAGTALAGQMTVPA